MTDRILWITGYLKPVKKRERQKGRKEIEKQLQEMQKDKTARH